MLSTRSITILLIGFLCGAPAMVLRAQPNHAGPPGMKRNSTSYRSTSSIEDCKRAARLGSLAAMNRLGVMYQDGDGLVQDKDIARFWYSRAARHGSAEAMNHLGMLFSYTRGFPSNYPVALYWFKRSAKLGNAEAMSNLGLMYLEARGVPRNYAAARRWWTKSVVRRNAEAMDNLGWLYQQGLGVPKNPERARQLYRRAIALGNAGAVVKLALLYEGGIGVPKNINLAVSYLRKAADLKKTEAMYALGELYEGQHEIPRDIEKAKAWYERGASTLEGPLTNIWPAEWAMGRLANSYETGSFTEQNYKMAMQWYQRLAALNDPNSMDRIAYLYEQGLGVAKNEEESRRWHAQAAALRPPQTPSTPDCTNNDLETNLRVFSLPESQVIALEYRNKTSATCVLRPDGGPTQGPNLDLKPNEIAHSSFRWRTVAADPSEACHELNSRVISVNRSANGILLISRTLLPHICSEVQYSTYVRGLFKPDWQAGQSRTALSGPKLTLSAPKQEYLKSEHIPLHVEVAGYKTVPQNEQGDGVLLRSITYLSGFTRIEEMRPLAQGASASDHHDAKREPPRRSFDFDGADQLDESSSSTVRFFTLVSGLPFGEIRLTGSNSIAQDFKDPADLARTWGETMQGVRVNLTLDKTHFQLGEDIAAHIAAQVVEAHEPVYGEPYVRQGAFFQSIAGGFHFSISDEDGPLENSDQPANVYGFRGGSSGPSVCPGALAVGKVVPLERSLREFGLLPTRPGTYQLSVTWSPYHSSSVECPNAKPDPPEQPFVTARSNTVTISVAGDAPATQLPQFPEYIAWRKHFELLDTAFGPRTALFDQATGLEWLRPTFTQGLNMPTSELSLTDRMAHETAFAGWRFATRDEVRSFLAHFTGTPDGVSRDPSIERKLLRLMGGKITGVPNQQTGWIDNRVTIRIAGVLPAPADLSPDGSPLTCNSCGPGFWAYYAFIREGVKDGQVDAIIDPDQQWKVMDRNKTGLTVFEGGTVHSAGFFLVHKQ